MNKYLQALSHAPLVWNDVLPPDFKGVRLPGGKLTSAVGDFGTLCIQEIKEDGYTIRYNVFDILDKLILKAKYKESGLRSQIILKGNILQQILPDLEWKLYQNQFSILHASSFDIISEYSKDIHISFSTFFSPKLVSEFRHLFSSVLDVTNQKNDKSALLIPPVWADADTLDLVHSILYCKYEKKFRRHYFNSRVRDLFFKYLLQSASAISGSNQPSQKEMDAVFEAERIINSNIAKHFTIPDLSKKVLLNDFRLKTVFKMIFGMGPYEYLVRKRLQKAVELLETGLSVKEAAAQVGYRPSDFSTAFTQFHGFPPSSVKRKPS